MKNNKEVKISYWAAHLTTIVSVTLVLIIIGIIALISISATNETRRLRERLEVNVVMADTISDTLTKGIAERISAQPYALAVKVISKEEALKNWKQDTGEDLEALFGVNPLSPEISFTIKSDYATDEELKKIDTYVSSIPGVEGTALPDSAMVENMNRSIERFALILGGIALVSLIISFVLINNTVHLAIYARRFTIHTMQLVGATNGFIRRPFVNNNMLSGFIAGLLATALLVVAFLAAPGAGFNNIGDYISWELMAIVCGGIVVAGILLCGIAAWVATTRYLHQDYDELFK
ncbi:MAG: permease-like cell division protein FtsX [Muribaculaceae bacterium]|nr:permease-like cell division protein FtsX [Muribaculaceae bacterium]